MSNDNERVKASPAIRRIARQYGIDLNEIVGTGEGGRIEVENLESYLLSKRHMSFAEMTKRTFEDDDEYVNYTTHEEKNDESPNYDFIDYGIIPEDNDIEIELYPIENEEESESCEVDFGLSEDEQRELEDYINIENELKNDFASVEEDDMNENKPDYEVYAAFKDIVEELTDEPTDSLMHFDLIEDDDYDEDYDEEEPYCDCDDECDCDECCDDDECDCGCEHDHHHHEEEKCQPIKISFTVNRNYTDELISNMEGENNELIINTVVKALALAIYDEDETFDGKINVVRMLQEERDIEVMTAVNALEAPIDEIVYEEPYDNPDVFVNVWDFTDFGFTSFARPDAGMVNVFVNLNSRKIIIDSVSDEYTVCIDTCAYIFKALKQNLIDVAKMNERSEVCVECEDIDDNDEMNF